MKATTATIPLDQIVSAGNIRHDLGDIDELANSILSVGLLEPPVVSDQLTVDGQYALLAGHRRVAALRKLKWSEVDVVIRHIPEADGEIARLIVQLVENLQRRDLEPIEEAQGYAQLRGMGVKQADIAKRVGRSPGHVSKRLALIDLPDEISAHADSLAAESLYEISKAAKAGADLSNLVDNLEHGRSDPRTVSILTDQALKRAQGMKQVEVRVAELEAQGVRVLPAKYAGLHPQLPKDRIGYGGFLGQVAQDDHAKEPCHAVCVYLQWGSDIHESAHCTDRRRHESGGASEIKIPEQRTAPTTAKPNAAAVAERRHAARISNELTRATKAAMTRAPSRDVVVTHITDDWYEIATLGGGPEFDVDAVYEALGGPEDADPDVWIHDQYTTGDTKTQTRVLWAIFISSLRLNVSDAAIEAHLRGYSISEFDRLVTVLFDHGFPPNLDDPGEEE